MEKQIENYIEENLKDGAKDVALAFVTYLREIGIEFYKDKGPCWKDKIYYWLKCGNACVGFLAIKDPEEPQNLWTVWCEDGNTDWSKTHGMDEELINIGCSRIDFCGFCHSCGGGKDRTILGRNFENVCNCTFRIDNPTAKELPFMKKMAEIRKNDILNGGNMAIQFAGKAWKTTTTKLVACGVPVSDLLPLADLAELEYLALETDQICDLTPICRLSRLKVLFLAHNAIVDVAPVRELINLTTLSFWDNRVRDITPLKGLTKLTALGLGANEVEDLTPLSEMHCLIEADLEHNRIKDVRPLGKLKSIKNLYLSDNAIDDISPLAGLTTLVELGLYKNKISDLSPLSNLTNLQKLELADNPLTEEQIAELQKMLPQCTIIR